EEQRIINVFNTKDALEDFSVAISYEDIAAKNYSLSAGQYFEVKIEYVDITPNEFATKLNGHTNSLETMFGKSRELEAVIQKQLAGIKYE
ncbi:MAG: SAM-dependent DNA methyltransferase, partial [Cytophagales bacterium]|nr:SAM-dependent DNA methyltransferase [Cytophagales bacterium]